MADDKYLDDRLARIEETLKNLETSSAATAATIARVDVTLVKQHASIEYHIKRTDLAEAALAGVRAELKPIALHVAVVGAIGKFLLGSGGAVGLTMLGIQLVRLIRGG
jgi:ABC-type Zn uptake system ZnuABC Zn-binding protein ZnuA